MVKVRNDAIRIVTLGCSKNTVDSEYLLGHLAAGTRNVIAGEEGGTASVVVINTCGFILDAKKESIDKILAFVDQKQAGKINKVFVMGCLSERYKDDLAREIPEIDGIFGVHEMGRVLAALGTDFRKELVGERRLTTPSHYAYLKISEGCDRQCSFCAIPRIRGAHTSRNITSILEEAEYLVNKGVKEIILIAQDLTYFGIDIHKKRLLPELVDKMAVLKGIEWLRLHYAYPAGFPAELLQVIKAHPNVCKYIDIPIQHISDRILDSMNRGLSGVQTRKLLETIRSVLPGAAIRTTIIAGYPGETDHEFSELYEFIRQFRFDRLGVFTYSHEENTPAYKLKNDIPQKVKSQRASELMHLQESISLDLNKRKVGKTFKVLIDGKEDRFYVGRTEFDSPEVDHEVLIPVEKKQLKTGCFYDVAISGAESFDLFGEVLST
jgi:ribosomal protein S12 methylthiotransferase